jgi:hypothetical protein
MTDMVSEAPHRTVAASERVVDALADATGTDPVALDPPLYEVVEPDALDAVVASSDDLSVSFDYGDHRVVVHADGSVTVGGTTDVAPTPRS